VILSSIHSGSTSSHEVETSVQFFFTDWTALVAQGCTSMVCGQGRQMMKRGQWCDGSHSGTSGDQMTSVS